MHVSMSRGEKRGGAPTAIVHESVSGEAASEEFPYADKARNFELRGG